VWQACNRFSIAGWNQLFYGKWRSLIGLRARRDGRALHDWSRDAFTPIGMGIEARRHMFKHIGVIAHQSKEMDT